MPYATAQKRRVARRRSYVARRAKILAQERGYRATRPEGFRNVQYKRRYGITIEQFDQMVADQDGRCAICREGFKPAKKKLAVHVDHCHKTQFVRGILCARCNLGLGLFKDSAEFLQKAIDYLKGVQR
jgi:hypothetical protein